MSQAPGRRPVAWPVVVSGLSLLVLAATLVQSVRPFETFTLGRRLLRDLRGNPRPLREQAGLWFDPDYTAFLADLKAMTPENATVAVIVPRRPDMYTYQAYYQLAPRRVVGERWKDEASFIATYRTELTRGPRGRPIANGELREK